MLRSPHWYQEGDRNSDIHEARLRRGLAADAINGRPQTPIAASELTLWHDAFRRGTSDCGLLGRRESRSAVARPRFHGQCGYLYDPDARRPKLYPLVPQITWADPLVSVGPKVEG